eukprot:TRINITY_DN734_c0_g1_i1.p1 TRINITY_DN734_c0_g1~~TRINITY_DN734_c0_g1_i1.p1  ORF type:complete len:236 (-),score=74.58 TRINITY_DN734_c0_g1_i1:218-925(-)
MSKKLIDLESPMRYMQDISTGSEDLKLGNTPVPRDSDAFLFPALQSISLKNYVDAEEKLIQALNLCNEVVEQNNESTIMEDIEALAIAQTLLGYTSFQQNKGEEARNYYEQAITSWTKVHPGNDDEVSEKLAGIYEDLAKSNFGFDNDICFSNFEKAIELWGRLKGSLSMERAKATVRYIMLKCSVDQNNKESLVELKERFSSLIAEFEEANRGVPPPLKSAYSSFTKQFFPDNE